MDKPRCLFSSIADLIELTTNSSITMITNRLINLGDKERKRVWENRAPRKWCEIIGWPLP